MNPILLTDSYKVTHWKQYPPGTTGIYSYLESRGGLFESTVFFGLQYILMKHLQAEVTTAHIEEASDVFKEHFLDPEGQLFNRTGWEHIVRDHGGRLPIVVKAVPEGTVVPTRNVLMTVENTCPQCYWVTNYVETVLSQVWYPTTVATLSREIKKLIAKYLDLTVGSRNRGGLEFKLHDFGFRGVSSVESAGIGGVGHLVNFRGTDTLEALEVARSYYGQRCAGHSIPAAEHSTITSWGRDYELAANENMLRQYPEGPVAVVSDSYDIYYAVEHLWGEVLRDRVLDRKGVVVIRPDSGKPVDVVLRCLTLLGEKFGTTTTKRGYKTLSSQVRIIQGDGVDYDSIRNILSEMYLRGWSAESIAFGMGGALLQKLNRDTQRMAFKCSAIEKGGQWWPVSKAPVTDPTKHSKAGRFDDLSLPETFRNGDLTDFQTLTEIQERAAI